MTERFDPAKHLVLIQEFLRSWGQDEIDPKKLPKIGFINSGAALFLIQTDSDFCILEFFLSKKDNGDRESLSSDVLRACINEARRLGFKKAIGLTENPKLKEGISKHFSFRPVGVFEMLEREL